MNCDNSLLMNGVADWAVFYQFFHAEQHVYRYGTVKCKLVSLHWLKLMFQNKTKISATVFPISFAENLHMLKVWTLSSMTSTLQ